MTDDDITIVVNEEPEEAVPCEDALPPEVCRQFERVRLRCATCGHRFAAMRGEVMVICPACGVPMRDKGGL